MQPTGMPTDTLVVLELTNSFASAWPALARDAGLRVEMVNRTEDFARADEIVGVVAAGGEEHRLEPTLHALPRSTAKIAAVVANGDHRLAASAMRAGASEFFVLTTDYEALRSWLREQSVQLAARRSGARTFIEGPSYELASIFGDSPALRAALEQTARLIPHPHIAALITGETGTGKELLARALHDNGPRRAAPFIELNCAAIPETLLEGELFGYEGHVTDAAGAKPGLFEIASGGTIFLDEIAHLPMPLQGKLLRAIEERSVRRVGGTSAIPIDVRVVAATHVNLARAVRRGEFREDLYYRLNVVPITLPPLRARVEDIVPLARRFLTKFAGDYDLDGAAFTPGAERALRSRAWPGNVRELRNAIERAVLLARTPVLDAAALEVAQDDPAVPAADGTNGLKAIIHRTVRETVDQCGGNKSDAARRLGISRTRLQRLLQYRPSPVHSIVAPDLASAD